MLQLLVVVNVLLVLTFPTVFNVILSSILNARFVPMSTMLRQLVLVLLVTLTVQVVQVTLYVLVASLVGP